MVTADEQRGGIYCRLSLASMGDTTNVDDQEQVCRRIAPPGVTISPEHVYKDNSRSAWRYDRKRPGWDAMLSAVEAGEIDSLIVYHGDRLVRQPRDMEDLIDIGGVRGILLMSPTGTYNLADPDHQMMLRWMVARAKNEIDHLSRRLREGHRRQRDRGFAQAAGRGGRAFAFKKDSVTHVPEEVTLVCEAADRVLAGEPTGVILRDWAARGVQTTTGGQWGYRSFKAMLLRPRYAGLMPDGESPAVWEPVFNADRDKAREVWEAVRATLTGKVVPVTPTNRARYLLSGLAVCGSCRHRLVIRRHPGNRYLLYGCVQRGCPKQVHRRVEYVDGYVIGAVLELLADEQLVSTLAEPADPGLAREIASLEAMKATREDQLRNLVDNPHVKPHLLVEAIESFDRRIAELRARVALSARRRLILRHAHLSEEGWEDLNLHTRRALVAACFTVTILPSRRGPGFDPRSVRLDPVTD